MTAGAAIWVKSQERDLTPLRDRLQYRRRQLQELYGPLRMLRARSRLLRESLPEDPRWRLVENIIAVKNTPERVVVDLILKTGEEVARLIIDRAGLIEEGLTTTDVNGRMEVEQGAPSSFHQFLRHQELLRAAWTATDGDEEQEARRLAEKHPFPRRLDDDINTGYQRVTQLLEELESQAT